MTRRVRRPATAGGRWALRRILIGASATAALGGLAACGSSNGSGTPRPSPTIVPTPTAAPQPTPTASETGAPNSLSFSPPVICLDNPTSTGGSTAPVDVTVEIAAYDADGRRIVPSANAPFEVALHGAP